MNKAGQNDRAQPPEDSGVPELIVLLVKVWKVLRLYERSNTIALRLKGELFGRLSEYLDLNGKLPLTIGEFEILFDEKAVYGSADRKPGAMAILARKLGVHTSTVTSICKRRRWGHI